MRVLVGTVVHHPLDARIHGRQIASLLEAGHDVTLVAPWSATRTPMDSRLRCVDVPRATGARRLRVAKTAAKILRLQEPDHDGVLVHDVDLVPAALRATIPAAWDVHEDTAAAVSDRPWLPRPLRPLARAGIRRLERTADRQLHLLLAEEGYQERFRHEHPVVRNVPIVPPRPTTPRRSQVVYLGRIASERGWAELRAMAERLRGDGIETLLMGQADAPIADDVAAAAAAGIVEHAGFVPNSEALSRVEGALAGVSLLHDRPNYRHSMPTKLIEYLSRGVPFVSTALPRAAQLESSSGGGLTVPFGDVDAVVEAVRTLQADPARREAMAAAGHFHVERHANWALEGPRFVEHLVNWFETA